MMITTRCLLAGLLALPAAACVPPGTTPGLPPPPQAPPAPPDGSVTLELISEHRTTPQTFTALHDERGRPYLYVTGRDAGLLVFEVSDPARPRLITTVPGSAFGSLYLNNLDQDGDALYVALGNFMARPHQTPGLAVVDVSDPANPTVTDVWRHDAGTRGAHVVEAGGGYAYLGGSFEGLIILDVSDRRDVRFVSRLVPDVDFPRANPPALQRPAARGLTLVSDDLLALAYDAGGLRLIDVSDKRAPREVGRYINPSINPAVQAQAYNNVVVREGVAYVAVDYCGVEVVDVRDPSRPRPLAWWNPWACAGNALNWFRSPGHASELVLRPEQDRLFVSAGDVELAVLDVRDPRAPVLEALYGAEDDNRVAWGLDVTDAHVYLAHVVSPGGPFTSNWAGVRVLAYR
jgi:hypothetical protein